MAQMSFKKLDESLPIQDDAVVKVTKMNRIVEVIHVDRKSDILKNYIKVDKNTYYVINRKTGEVTDEREYNLNENRAQNIAGLKNTMKNIRDLINNNFTGAKNELFITLTYRFIDDSL